MDEQAKNEVPVYPYGQVVAMENGEAEQYEASRKADIACWEAIAESINGDRSGIHLPENIAHSVVEQFGAVRVAYVLATQMQMRASDTDFSRSNLDWAQSIPMFLPVDSRWYLSAETHSAKLDEFITSARREMGQIPGLREKEKALKAIPVYPHSVEYASEKKEMGQYWQSYFANVACKEALDSAISRHYSNNRLDTKAASLEVTNMYGFDRTLHVLANTLRHEPWDGRYSRSNVSWAESMPVTDQPDRTGNDNSQDYRVGLRGSSGLTNLLVNQVRKDYALVQAQQRAADGKDIPVYRHTGSYAKASGELEQYRASRDANKVCRDAIDATIRDKWDGMHLPADAAKVIVERFGPERVAYVLANTVQQRNWDDRFSNDAKKWARSVPMYVSRERRREFALRSHPEKLKEFITLSRKELEQFPKPQNDRWAFHDIPLYQRTHADAVQRGEEAQYWDSHDANISCRDAIADSIRQNFRDGSLGIEAANQTISAFGYDRTLYVLSNTIRRYEWDSRISEENREWAFSAPDFDNTPESGWRASNEYSFEPDKTGIAGLNLLMNQVREEYEAVMGRGKRPKVSQRKKQSVKEGSYRKVPIYLQNRAWAEMHGEIEQYNAAHAANRACASAIDRGIALHYDGSIVPRGIVQDAIKEFGAARVQYVLAQTVKAKAWDGRFSYGNKEWSGQIPTCEDRDKWECACRSHPGILDVVITQAREEILIHTPLKREDIKAEAQSILTAFQQLREPNTEDGAHFAVNVSDMFVKRAKPKDMERLSNMLPFVSLSIATVPGRYGTSAVISQDENRFQKLVLRRPSIRAQLAAKPPERETPAPKPRTKEAALE